VPESFLQRAELLADLGRYGEAAAELAGAGPDDVAALTLLARVRLAGGAPREALAAADAAVRAGPADLGALIARGMVLAGLGRVDEAAAQAEEILRRGRGDGYACTSAAAILAGGRTGQVALDAAWEGVRLSPQQPRAHLVLGVVAARLGMREIAERAYREALALDPALAVPPAVPAALGLARAEQHRYAAALAHLGRGEPALPELDRTQAVTGDLGQLLRYGAGYSVVAPLLVVCAYGYGAGAALVSVLLAGAGLAAGWLAWRRLPDWQRAGLPELVRADRRTAVRVGAVVTAPVLLLLSALLGSAWPLVAAVVAGVVALAASRPGRRTGPAA
jgi:tetratricopeptide (TPR) repeat protein